MSAEPLPLRAAIRPTTFIESLRLSQALGTEVLLATESFQHTGSFKFRAAYNVASKVSQSKIIAASSGNFGQALAYACQLTGKSCIIVMPQTSARVKVEAVRQFGGIVDLIDVRTKSRKARVEELARENPGAYIASAYDDPLVIEGNATLGEEIALRHDIDCVVAPLGGGGLVSGLINGVRSANRNIEILAAEPSAANDGARSLREGRIVANETEPDTIADGVRTISLGVHNWAILKDGLSGAIEVPEHRITEAMRQLFALANLKSEPTGALGIAALLTQPDTFRGKRVCCVVTGGNVDPALFVRIVDPTTS